MPDGTQGVHDLTTDGPGLLFPQALFNYLNKVIVGIMKVKEAKATLPRVFMKDFNI